VKVDDDNDDEAVVETVVVGDGADDEAVVETVVVGEATVTVPKHKHHGKYFILFSEAT